MEIILDIKEDLDEKLFDFIQKIGLTDSNLAQEVLKLYRRHFKKF